MGDDPSARGRIGSLEVRSPRADERSKRIADAANDAVENGARTLKAITDALTAKGVRAPSGGTLTPTIVDRALERNGLNWRKMVADRNSRDVVEDLVRREAERARLKEEAFHLTMKARKSRKGILY